MVIGSTGAPYSRSPWCDRMRCDHLGPERVGETGNRVARLAHHQRAERHVADEIPLACVAGGRAVVQLLELADVVQERAGHDEIRIGVVLVRQDAPARAIFRTCSRNPPL